MGKEGSAASVRRGWWSKTASGNTCCGREAALPVWLRPLTSELLAEAKLKVARGLTFVQTVLRPE